MKCASFYLHLLQEKNKVIYNDETSIKKRKHGYAFFGVLLFKSRFFQGEPGKRTKFKEQGILFNAKGRT